MKKRIVIIAAIVFSATMFFSSNKAISTEGFDFSKLVSLNSADAECGFISNGQNWHCDSFNQCNAWGVWASCSW